MAAEEHRRWLDGVLGDPDRHLWMAEVDGRPVGQVRFDRVRGYAYEVSVSIDPDARGAGLGTGVIRAGCEELWRRTNAARVVAAVRAENEASKRAFSAAGFRPDGGAEDGFDRFALARPDEWAPGLRNSAGSG